MALMQKLSMVLAAVLALTLTVACQNQRLLSNQSTTPIIVQTLPDAGPGVNDAGEPAMDVDEEETVKVDVGLKKNAWDKHFVVELMYRGPINIDGAQTIKATVKRLNDSLHDPQSDPVEAVVFVIDSEGGEMGAGTVMVEALQSLEMPLVCVADHRALSMAFYIMESACPVRVATDRTALMVHEPHMEGAMQLQDPNRWDFWNVAEGLRAETDGWLTIIAKRMLLDPQALMTRLRGGVSWYMTSDEALKAHAVDAVVGNIKRDVEVPLTEGLVLPRRLGVPEGLLRAPAAPLPEPAGRHRRHR